MTVSVPDQRGLAKSRKPTCARQPGAGRWQIIRVCNRGRCQMPMREPEPAAGNGRGRHRGSHRPVPICRQLASRRSQHGKPFSSCGGAPLFTGAAGDRPVEPFIRLRLSRNAIERIPFRSIYHVISQYVHRVNITSGVTASAADGRPPEPSPAIPTPRAPSWTAYPHRLAHPVSTSVTARLRPTVSTSSSSGSGT